jgi:hypothetical protein
LVNPIYQQYWDIDHPVASKVPPFQDRFLRLSLASLQLFALRKEAAAEALEVRPMGGDIPGEAWGKRWKHVGKVVKHMGKHGKNIEILGTQLENMWKSGGNLETSLEHMAEIR